jgi:hypothetical protein
MEASDQSSPSITELKWWRKRCVTLTQSYFWILLCKGYDTAAAMMIAVLWAWIVPLVAYPKKGCPADGNECWDFCGFLFFYICLATALLPLVAVVLQGRCSRLAVEMHRRGNRVRRKFFERARHLLLGSGKKLLTTARGSLQQFGAALETHTTVPHVHSQSLYFPFSSLFFPFHHFSWLDLECCELSVPS